MVIWKPADTKHNPVVPAAEETQENGHNPVVPAAQETQENGHNPVVPTAQKTQENGAPKTCDHKAKHTFRQTALSMRFSVYFHCIRICWIFYSYNLYVKKNIHGY